MFDRKDWKQQLIDQKDLINNCKKNSELVIQHYKDNQWVNFIKHTEITFRDCIILGYHFKDAGLYYGIILQHLSWLVRIKDIQFDISYVKFEYFGIFRRKYYEKQLQKKIIGFEESLKGINMLYNDSIIFSNVSAEEEGC